MKQRNAALLLLLTSAIWGLSFVAQSDASGHVGPFTFNSLRFFIGAIVLLPFALPSIRKQKSMEGYWKKTLSPGIACGLCLAAASVTQQIGVATSGAGKGGFITSLYVVIVPFISLIMGSKIQAKTWIAGVIALIGMYLLCLTGEGGLASGDLWLIACALLFSLHIIVIDSLGAGVDGVTLSMFQFLTAGILTLPGMLVEGPSMATLLAAWLPIAYAGVFSCGIAYTLQVVAQKHIKPSSASLILSLESVWAAIGGALILSERMSLAETIGSALVFLAVILGQLQFPTKEESA